MSGGAAAGLFLSAIVCMGRDTAERVVRPPSSTGCPASSSSSAATGSRTTRRSSSPAGGSSSSAPPTGRSEADLRARDRPGDGRASSTSPARTSRKARSRSMSVVRLARARDIPVIVDAAAQLPPVENLWRFHGGRRRPRAVQRRQGVVRARQHRPRPRPRAIRRPLRRSRRPAAADRPADEGRQGGPHRDPGGGRVVPRAGPRRRSPGGTRRWSTMWSPGHGERADIERGARGPRARPANRRRARGSRSRRASRRSGTRSSRSLRAGRRASSCCRPAKTASTLRPRRSCRGRRPW